MGESGAHSEENTVIKTNKTKLPKRKRKAHAKNNLAAKKSVPDYKIPDFQDVLGDDVLDRDEQELELEKLVFGGEDDVIQELIEEKVKKCKKKKKKKSMQGFYIQTAGEDTGDEDLQVNGDHMDAEKPIWHDDDDDILVHENAATLKNSLRSMTQRGSETFRKYNCQKFKKVMGASKWTSKAKHHESEDSEEEDELLQKTGNFLSQSSSLPKGIINVRKCEYLNEDGVQAGIIKSVEFHPTSKVALVAGLSGTATLYQVDGKTNPKIQSVHFQRFPIHTAHFTMEGDQIVVGSKDYGHFFYYDMIAGKIVRVPWEKDMDQMNVRRFHMSPDGRLMAIHGKYGNIHLVTAKTKEWIGSLKMNGEVMSIAFNGDGSKMFSHGDSGQVYVWDMLSRTCIHRFNDEGCVIGTSLAVSPNEQYFATGSDCGVVNIYEMPNLLSSSDPQPLKTLMNLTTEATSLKFNCTSEILAMVSSHKVNSIKLVHFPSITVFTNFPIMNQDLRYINSLDISLNSGYLAFGNNQGKAYLYRLKHYGNY